MSWQRRARYVIAAVGLTCAGAVYYYGHQRKMAPPPPPPVKPLDPQATGQATSSTIVRKDGDKIVYKISSNVRTDFPDRTHFEGKVHFEKPGDQRSFELNMDSADQTGDTASRKGPASVLANGRVDLITSDGLELKADSMTYRDATGIVEIPGRVTVIRGRLTGEANGATWNRDTNVLWLLDASRAVQAPDERGEGGFDARSKTMQLARNDKFMRMEGDNPVLTRDKETLSADFLILRFTQDEKGLEQIEMRGRSSVEPKPGVKDGPPAMKAGDITLGFHPDGRSMKQSTLNNNATLALRSDAGPRTIAARWIDARMAPDGQTLTGLDAKDGVDVTLPETADAPARKIDAATLAAKGDDKNGLTSARFEGGVNFVETRAPKGTQAATKRTGESRTMVLGLNGAIDAVRDAEFRQDVTFKDVNLTAIAGWAKYFAPSGDLQLRPADAGAKTDPWVTNGSVEASARDIKVSGSHDLDASGDVKTVSVTRKSAAPARAQTPGFFDEDKPVHGTSAKFRFDNATGKGTYTGDANERARVFQDQDGVRGDVIVVERESNNLSAKGRVESVFRVQSGFGGSDKPGDKAALIENTATGTQMTYVDAERKAVYTGDAAAPATLKGPDGRMTAGRIVIFLAEEQRSLDRLEATGDVEMHLTGDRDALGDRLTYSAATEDYVLEAARGRDPGAMVKAPQNDGSGQCAQRTGLSITFSKAGRVRTPEGTTPTPSKTIPCSTVLKR